MPNILTKYIFTFLLSLIIIFLSTFPFGPMEVGADIPFADKWVHFLMYGAVSFTLLFDFTKNHPFGKVKTKHIITSILTAIFLGGAMELVQGIFLSYRSGDWIDMLANCTGALLGAALGYLIVIPAVNIYNGIFCRK